MPVAWRLADPRYAHDLEGSGNRRFGARWNSPGGVVVYCSEHLSLCILESCVHLNPQMRRDLPPRSAIRLAVPDDASSTVIGPADWPADGDPRQLAVWCRARGDAWLELGASLVLSAPSAIVPQEQNIMLNPPSGHAARLDS